MLKISDKLQTQANREIKFHGVCTHQNSITAYPVLARKMAKGSIYCRMISTDRKMMDYFYQLLLPITQSDWKHDKLK